MEKPQFSRARKPAEDLIIKRGGEDVVVSDKVFEYSKEKRLKLEDLKELVDKYFQKVPDASWADTKDYFSKALEDLGDRDRASFRAYFNTVKAKYKEGGKREVDPVFNQIALFINKELKESKGAAKYEDIIVKFFEENMDSPVLDNIDDSILKRCEDVYPKMVANLNK